MSTSKIGGLSARISSTYPIRAQAQARGLESGWSRTSEPTGPGRFAQCVDPVTVWRDRQLLPFGTLSKVYDSAARQFNNSMASSPRECPRSRGGLWDHCRKLAFLRPRSGHLATLSPLAIET